MQQRQLRLGDILDDYCTRERRLTNHVVVAMVGPEVKQTRCTTCDAEHEYKGGKVPAARRKKDAPEALYDQVLAEVTRAPAGSPAVQPRRVEARTAPPQGRLLAPEAALRAAAPVESGPSAPATPATSLSDTPEGAAGQAGQADGTGGAGEKDGPVHRALIRATLPRTEATLPTRQMPEFTIRQNDGRPGKFRAGAPHRFRTANGNGQPGNGSRQSGRPGTQGGRGGHGASAQRQRSSHQPAQGVRAAARPGRHKKRSR